MHHIVWKMDRNSDGHGGAQRERCAPPLSSQLQVRTRRPPITATPGSIPMRGSEATWPRGVSAASAVPSSTLAGTPGTVP